MTSLVASDGTRSFYRESGTSSAPPPLENGDRLTLREFIRRYEAMPHVKKAELIGGTVFMGAAVRLNYHGRPHGWLGNVVTTYAMLCRSGFTSTQCRMHSRRAPSFRFLPLLPHRPSCSPSPRRTTCRGHVAAG